MNPNVSKINRFAFFLGNSATEDLIAELPYQGSMNHDQDTRAQDRLEKEFMRAFQRQLFALDARELGIEGLAGKGFTGLVKRALIALAPRGTMQFHDEQQERLAQSLGDMRLHGAHYAPEGAGSRHARLIPGPGGDLSDLALAAQLAAEEL